MKRSDWAPRSGGPRMPAHFVTTRHLSAAYPFVSEGELSHNGVLIGDDLFGGSFTFDPFALYQSGQLSNPNIVIFGQIGRGKSALIKTYLWRQAVFGRRAWIVDPKGEYSPLATAWGSTPVALRPGSSVRLNPLDTRPWKKVVHGSSPNEDVPAMTTLVPGGDATHAIALLSSLATACMRRELAPRERVAVELAYVNCSSLDRVPTLPRVVEALLDPTEASAKNVRTSRAQLLEDGRDVALELRRLVSGDLRGMFDGPTTPGIDLGGPLVVLDLSSLYNSPALGVLMVCAAAWLQATLPTTDDQAEVSGPVTLVVDEAWAILTHLGIAKWLQSSWKLSRAYGISNVAILHRISDLNSVGHAGSQEVGLAHGLLSDSETCILYAQPPAEVKNARDILGLSTTEAELLPRLRRGVALWKVGRRSFLVQHLLSSIERNLVYTDGAMDPPR